MTATPGDARREPQLRLVGVRGHPAVQLGPGGARRDPAGARVPPRERRLLGDRRLRRPRPRAASLYGRYLYGDFCGRAAQLHRRRRAAGARRPGPRARGRDAELVRRGPAGHLYVVSLGAVYGGAVSRDRGRRLAGARWRAALAGAGSPPRSPPRRRRRANAAGRAAIARGTALELRRARQLRRARLRRRRAGAAGLLFVVEQPGTISVVRKGGSSGAPFLDIRDRVSSAASRGSCRSPSPRTTRRTGASTSTTRPRRQHRGRRVPAQGATRPWPTPTRARR